MLCVHARGRVKEEKAKVREKIQRKDTRARLARKEGSLCRIRSTVRTPNSLADPTKKVGRLFSALESRSSVIYDMRLE
jgi:hypothetical protein